MAFSGIIDGLGISAEQARAIADSRVAIATTALDVKHSPLRQTITIATGYSAESRPSKIFVYDPAALGTPGAVIGAPADMIEGGIYILEVINAVGFTFSADWNFGSAGAPTLTSGTDLIVAQYDGAELLATHTPGF